jgi:acetyltransferase EpsM
MKTSGITLIVAGAGWHGREVRAYLQDLVSNGEHIHLLGFIDELQPRGQWLDTQVLGSFDDLSTVLSECRDEGMRYITATGNNELRQRFVRQVEEQVLGLTPWTLIHPRSSIGTDVEVDEGACIAPGAVLTTHIHVGKHCIVNVNASVSHDSVIGDFTNINPGAVVCGNVRIGKSSYIGAGATIIDKLTIGEGAVIGAGAVVISDIPAYATAVGVPAQVIKIRTPRDMVGG